MSEPKGVCVAFSDPALEPNPTWFRLDDPDGFRLVDGWTIERGRSTVQDRTRTGTAEVSTKPDVEANLDPTDDSTIFFGQIDPQRQACINLQNPLTGEWSMLIRGHVDWPAFSWTPDKGYHMTATIDIADAFDLFANLLMSPGHHGSTPPIGSESEIYFAGEQGQWSAGTTKHVDGRIHDALDDAGWSSVFRDVFSGNVNVQENVYERLDALLTVLMDAVDAEWLGVSNCYMARNGVFRFRGRYARFHPETPGYGIVHWSCGTADISAGDPTVAPISDLILRRSQDDLINAAMVLPQGIDESDIPGMLVKDDTSIATYGWRLRSWENLLVFSGHDDVGDPTTALVECSKVATWVVENFKDPKTRVAQIRFAPRDPASPGGAALWALMCGVEIGDLIHLQTTHPAGGGIDEDYYVEGIRYDAKPMTEGVEGGWPNVSLELDVSPRSFFDENPFVGDDAGLS